MFQFRGFPPYSYGFTIRWYGIAVPGFPIRKSADQWIFAPTRSLSQLVTSFFGSWCQVILPTLFIAWSNDRFSNYLRIRDYFLIEVFTLFLEKPFHIIFENSHFLGFVHLYRCSSYSSLSSFTLFSFQGTYLCNSQSQLMCWMRKTYLMIYSL